MVTDALVYILPLFLLPTLQLNSKRKTAGLVISFSVGLLVAVCTITRLVSKKWIDKPTDVAFIISNTQLCAGIIVACLPPLKWLYHSFKYHQRTTGHVTVASATDSQAYSDPNKAPSPGDSSPSSEGEKGEHPLFATSSADAVSVPSQSNGGGSGGVKGGWKSLRVTTKSKGCKSGSSTGTGSAGRTGAALTWSTWDPDEEEILARFGEYDSNGAVPVRVDEEKEGSQV